VKRNRGFTLKCPKEEKNNIRKIHYMKSKEEDA